LSNFVNFVPLFIMLRNSKKPQAKAGKDKGQTGQKSMVGDTDGTFLSTEPVAEQAGENSIAKSNQVK